MSPVLHTARLTLRLPDAQDLPHYAAYNATERSRWNGGPRDGVESFRHFAQIAGHWQLRGFGVFILERDGNPIGFAGPWQPEGWPEGEIGWSLWNQKDEGSGLAYEAAQAARSWAFQSLGWTTAVSYIRADNARSLALAKRLGAFDDTGNSRPCAVLPPSRVYRHPITQVTQ